MPAPEWKGACEGSGQRCVLCLRGVPGDGACTEDRQGFGSPMYEISFIGLVKVLCSPVRSLPSQFLVIPTGRKRHSPQAKR